MLRTPTLLALCGIGSLLAAPSRAATAELVRSDLARCAVQDPKPSIDALIGQLGNGDFRVRLEAEQALRARGKEALPALQRAADNDGDREVQWRARRLIREIERGEQAGLDRRPAQPRNEDRGQRQQQQPQAPQAPQQPGMRPFMWRFGPGIDEDVQRRFDELFNGLERDFGMDIPRGRFFDDSFFKDLQQQMEEMRAQLQQGTQGGGGNRSMSMQVGPGGVRVEVKTRDEKGEESSQVYEAPDLESFREKYPGVLEQNGLGGGMRLWFGDGRLPNWQPMQPMPPIRSLPFGQRPWSPRADAEPAAPGDEPLPPPDDRRLGVVVRPSISDELREHLGLGANEGLMVDSVQDGTLAQALGLERGDIVTAIGDRRIGNTDDVQQALAAIGAGETVTVKFVRQGAVKTASAPKPKPQPKAAPKLEKRTRDGGEVIR